MKRKGSKVCNRSGWEAAPGAAVCCARKKIVENIECILSP
jgi:hypothetical protein